MVGVKFLHVPFRELAADPKTTTQQEFAQFMRDDIAKWQKVAQMANIKLD